MYLMILKLESLALSFSRKNAFLLAAGVRNLKSYTKVPVLQDRPAKRETCFV